MVATTSAHADEAIDGKTSTAPGDDDDPLTARLRAEVHRYYSETGSELTEANEQSGIDAARFMLLDGVSVEQIEAAVDQAILRHRPDQPVRFEVAVPMRVGGTDSNAPPPAATSSEPADMAPPAPRPAVETNSETIQKQLEIQKRLRRKHRIKGSLALGFGIGMIPFGSLGVGSGIGLLAFVDALDNATAQADGFGALFYGLFFTLLGPAAYLAAIPAIIGGISFIVTGSILVGVGTRHLQESRKAALLEHPERRYSLARRAQVNWGFRLQL